VNFAETAWRIALSSHDKVRGTVTEDSFIALLDASNSSLDIHLRHFVGLAKRYEVGVNYMQLLNDIISWDDPSKNVRITWAREFWGRRQD
jgi:CRISPR type I-E-associated protein CasB/Cse2